MRTEILTAEQETMYWSPVTTAVAGLAVEGERFPSTGLGGGSESRATVLVSTALTVTKGTESVMVGKKQSRHEIACFLGKYQYHEK